MVTRTTWTFFFYNFCFICQIEYSIKKNNNFAELCFAAVFLSQFFIFNLFIQLSRWQRSSLRHYTNYNNTHICMPFLQRSLIHVVLSLKTVDFRDFLEQFIKTFTSNTSYPFQCHCEKACRTINSCDAMFVDFQIVLAKRHKHIYTTMFYFYCRQYFTH